MAALNGRPLTADNLNDPTSVEPLTSNHLIAVKSHIILPPLCKIERTDLYTRERCRRIQYLIDQFWVNLRTEYLQSIQRRTKWFNPKKNLEIGDIFDK